MDKNKSPRHRPSSETEHSDNHAENQLHKMQQIIQAVRKKIRSNNFPSVDVSKCVSQLQFAVLDALKDGKKSGREIRNILKKDGLGGNTPASFYQLMSRLEKADLVDGEYEEKTGEFTIPQRWYVIRDEGMEAWKNTLTFYLSKR